MNFSEAIRANPPRLVVTFRWGGDGSEQFEWGIVGEMPPLTLIGRVSAVIGKLHRKEWIPECPEQALVITWHAPSREMLHFVHGDIPYEALAGMLEIVKFHLIAARLEGQAMARRGPARPPVLGPDGRPFLN